MRRNACHGMGLPGIRTPARNRATNSSSVDMAARPPGFPVMSGGTSFVWALSAASIAAPPASRGPVYAPVTILRWVWHPAQAATAVTRYAPRSRVGPEGGLSAGGGPLGPIGLIAHPITALPQRLRPCSGPPPPTPRSPRHNVTTPPHPTHPT